jgi:hypothetical protein
LLVLHGPGLQVPSLPQIWPAVQSEGLPQYTTLPPPPVPVPVPVLVVEPPVPVPPVPVLVVVPPVPPPTPPVPPVPPWQDAVLVPGLTTQVPVAQPHSVQSPEWHCPSEPQVSFASQSADVVQPPGEEAP